MSKRIQVYTDTTFCNKMTFIITAMVWGSPELCRGYEQEILRVLRAAASKSTIISELHACELTEGNWPTKGAVHISVLAKLRDYLLTERLNMAIIVHSMVVHNANATYLKGIIRKWVEDRDGPIGELFTSFDQKDLPALYHRVFLIESSCRAWVCHLGPSKSHHHIF